MSRHGFVDHSVFQIIENVVVVGLQFRLVYEILELLLQAFPAALHASRWQLLFGPLAKFYVHSGVEHTC